MQVLKDIELRAAYDKQLLENGHGKGLFISDEVHPYISDPTSLNAIVHLKPLMATCFLAGCQDCIRQSTDLCPLCNADI